MLPMVRIHFRSVLCGLQSVWVWAKLWMVYYRNCLLNVWWQISSVNNQCLQIQLQCINKWFCRLMSVQLFTFTNMYIFCRFKTELYLFLTLFAAKVLPSASCKLTHFGNCCDKLSRTAHISREPIQDAWTYVNESFKMDGTNGDDYRKTSNLRRNLIGNKIVDHSDVVGASPDGAAPSTSSFSTYHLASTAWAKAIARWDDKHLRFGIWCGLC